MSSEKNIVHIAREFIKNPILKNFNDIGLNEKFGISPEEVQEVKRHIKALELEILEESGIPPSWYEIAALMGPQVLSLARRNDWKRLESRYGDKIPLSLEDLKTWGRWLVSRQDVGHLVNLEPLFTNKPEPVPSDSSSEKTKQKYISDKRIWYDEERDTYTTYIPHVPHAIELPGEVHRDLVRAYSNFDGSPASINELARTFHLPRNWIVKYLRVHEITHDREPFTPEEIMSKSEEELAHEALQIRRAALYTRLERDKWKNIQKDAKKWREYEAHALKKLEKIVRAGGAKKVPKLHIPKGKRDFLAVISPTDFHWGKYGDVYECGEKYDRPTARERLISSTEKVLGMVTKYGRPEKIIIGIGSDFFNADTYHATTTKGTPQDNDGNMSEILTTGCEMMSDYIDLLRQVAPVEMVLMSGNHDQLLSISLHLYLQAWYRNCSDVTTIRSGHARQYIIYKNNLLCFHHGDSVSKTSDLARLAAIEASKAWGTCDHHMVFTGHLHYEKVVEDRGFIRYQLPSLSGEDKWHARKGYTGNRKIIDAVLVDGSEGILSAIYAKGEV